MKRILVTGATGFMGRALTGKLIRDGWHVHALTRDPMAARKQLPDEVEILPWNPSGSAPFDLPEGISAVVHLAGESLARWPWSRSRKDRLWKSRVDVTHLLVNALARMQVKPAVLVSASGMGYYGDCGAREVLIGDPPGRDFLGRLAAAWEMEALKAERLGIRVVLPRFGLVLDSGGGMLPRMLLPFRLGLGAVLGSGDQYWSWIHRDDAVSLVCRMLENSSFQGPLHAVAGPPLTQKEFAKILAQSMHKPLFFKIPRFILRILMGEMADLLLFSQKSSFPPDYFRPKIISLQEAVLS